ncbi:Hypothetical protein SRAE_X000233700 [Strongyloides ratti]|uniref:Uncharacterized protein n=1 Tax=Strongyloides ratti TaxID=34506 RepID=A0A090KXJ7_STRRB|nr:Hypothetical protein SRAE_X000233700 [Strongyloides ratti]CEF60602.1 Hypothetical protein SRAE_X000233700 [Strongyloides ratti]
MNNIVKKCFLCQKELTTSHILSGCESNLARINYITRHDAILASITNSILKAIGSKYMPLCELRNLKECNIIGKDWSIGFNLPQLMEVGQTREQYEQVFEPLDDRRRSVKKIVYNRSDLVLVNHKLKKVILLEVAVVGNPWLLQQQVEIKRVRYMVNSQEVIGPDNYQTVNRAYNMNDHFKKKYGKDYQISFIPFIMSAYGEISPGFMEGLMKPLEVLMKKQHIKAMTENASRTAAVNTAYTIRYWLSMLQG